MLGLAIVFDGSRPGRRAIKSRLCFEAVKPHFFWKGTRTMSIISWIILGLIAGFIGAKLVNREGQGFWLDIALGIVGALVGGFLFALFGASGFTGLNIYSMIVAIVGSVVVLLIYNAFMGRRGA